MVQQFKKFIVIKESEANISFSNPQTKGEDHGYSLDILDFQR